YVILTCLLTAPDFNLTNYRYAGSPLLLPPAPLDQLSTGPQSASTYFLFRAEEINKSTIDGNDELLSAFMNQIGLNNTSGRHFLKDLVLPIVADQLSISRCRSLSEQLSEEENSFDRLDWI